MADTSKPERHMSLDEFLEKAQPGEYELVAIGRGGRVVWTKEEGHIRDPDAPRGLGQDFDGLTGHQDEFRALLKERDDLEAAGPATFHGKSG